MDWHVWVAYFVAAWVIALSPGSGAVLSMSHGLAYGVRAASVTILGLQLGLSVILVVAGLGVGALLVASATAFTLVKVVGAFYLIWLGYKQWVAPVAPASSVPESSASSPAATAHLVAIPAWQQRLSIGFFTNVTNPKGIVFMVAVLPQFIVGHHPLWLQLLILWITSVAIDLIVMHGYAWLASSAQRWLATARARRVQNRLFGGVLMAMGASLFLVKRTTG
jgi:homoserine/homoserine lactone efflux protein